MNSMTTGALVLRHVKQGDTSHVVTLLTRESGKIAVMAKGNRKPGSRFGAGLELFNLSRVTYRARPNRDLQFLEGCELERNYERLRQAVDFKWSPKEWYHLKSRVEIAADGSGAA